LTLAKQRLTTRAKTSTNRQPVHCTENYYNSLLMLLLR